MTNFIIDFFDSLSEALSNDLVSALVSVVVTLLVSIIVWLISNKPIITIDLEYLVRPTPDKCYYPRVEVVAKVKNVGGRRAKGRIYTDLGDENTYYKVPDSNLKYTKIDEKDEKITLEPLETRRFRLISVSSEDDNFKLSNRDPKATIIVKPAGKEPEIHFTPAHQNPFHRAKKKSIFVHLGLDIILPVYDRILTAGVNPKWREKELHQGLFIPLANIEDDVMQMHETDRQKRVRQAREKALDLRSKQNYDLLKEIANGLEDAEELAEAVENIVPKDSADKHWAVFVLKPEYQRWSSPLMKQSKIIVNAIASSVGEKLVTVFRPKQITKTNK